MSINDRTPTIVNSLGFHHFVAATASGKKGGLLLLWRPGVDIEPVNVNSNAISALVYSDPPNHPWLVSFVYAPAQWKQKASFWNHLNSIHNSFTGPWLCIGDFNDLQNQPDKSGGRPVTSSSIGGLQNLMDSCGLIDIGFSGPSFTWSNNRTGRALIRERIDRGIANAQWRLLFPEATIQHISSAASDHNPLLLNTTKIMKKPSSFKFEEFWIREPLSNIIIEEAWKKQFYGNPSFILCRKIKETKMALKF
ncbi:uncharacterized protein LOC122282211 [Carya illinoinensis]|uniref:uncharacterized protein LOC122282211 n=1 Tax=Carya illinoinensis TaxID=32201 RepID=UPI001C71F001|nr:uncharacterized protein LOC122282211 [Carya illinoinensis]